MKNNPKTENTLNDAIASVIAAREQGSDANAALTEWESRNRKLSDVDRATVQSKAERWIQRNARERGKQGNR